MNWVIYAAISVVMGIICYFIAKKQGRPAVLWFVGGILFSVLGLAALVATNQLKIKKGGG